MTLEYRAGGRRRLDHVLDPQNVADLRELEETDLRERRGQAQQEEADLSYVRRLLQGRLDILEAERAHRSGERPAPGRGGERTDAELVKALASVLADETRSTRGSGRHLTTEPSRIGEHRRAAELAVADVRTSDPAILTDAELAGAISRLRGLEGTVSSTRRGVQDVEQRLTDELARRLQTAAR